MYIVHAYAYVYAYDNAYMYTICVSHLPFFEVFLNLSVNLNSLWRSITKGYFSLLGFSILCEVCLFPALLQELQERQLFGRAWKGLLLAGHT